MGEEKEKKSLEEASLDEKDKEIQKLMEEHPFETMSQVENRYGDGREKNGSSGPHEKPFINNH